MDRKKEIPALRPGCFPMEAIPFPPHNHRLNREGLRVMLVYRSQYATLPAISVPTGTITQVSETPLYEVMTGNGWRCYIQTWDVTSLITLLNMAGAGIGGVQRWMRGEPITEATEAAERQFEEEQQRRKSLPVQQGNASLDSLLSIDDIQIDT